LIIPKGELRVAELRIGEFFLNPRDIIDEVVQNDDIIQAVDFDSWLVKEEKYFHATANFLETAKRTGWK
jgi:hypothetical protein